MQYGRYLKKAGIAVCWLALWELLAGVVHNPILVVGPYETIMALAGLISQPEFVRAVGRTTLMILGGFIAGWASGMMCAGIAYKIRLFRELLEPVMLFLRSVPIASFVVLLLIWQGSGKLSFVIGFMVVFVIMYGNVLSGLQGMNESLVQEAKILHVDWYRRVGYIYLPEIYPEMKSGLELSVGMAFKSGIAAEIIGQPTDTVGNAIYRSKIFLATDEVLAYTLAAICVAWIAEKLIVTAWSRIFGPRANKKGK